ncbi:MAG TPA: DnaB-like helicase C-terminal domain-containing protein, partial [Gemmatimonadota bacterium]|nr:DnaB-like helicase C-terminal domain-containing protein [Gemmatimonadota bacterium]
EITEISRSLKALAKELNIPVIALSQLSRAPEHRGDARPKLADLRESGCLTGDTPVYLPDEGVYRPIEELVGGSDFRALALDLDTWKLGPAPVSRVFQTGVKPVLRLTTRLGRTIRATANHKFLAFDGWKRLDAISVDERIALPPMQTAGISNRALQADLGHQYCGSTLYKSAMSRERAARVAGVVRSESLKRLARSDVYWDRVVSVEPDGVEAVYDMTVPGPHNFVAGDVIVHNSIEQDADLVVFLYRDDYYNPETSEKKGVAEIIVGKNRNGPTGSVELAFLQQFMRFENLDRFHSVP